MAYWWVAQGKKWKQCLAGRYLWAPQKTNAKKGPALPRFYWHNLQHVRAGDIIISYVDQKLVAISSASSSGYVASRPEELKAGDIWEASGYRVDVEYELLKKPIDIKALAPVLMPMMDGKYSPLTKNGTAAEGYLYSLSPEAGRLVLDFAGIPEVPSGDDTLNRSLGRNVPDETQRKALVDSRIGQGAYRNGLLTLWGGRCSVTKLDLEPLLTASHIKPWRDSDNSERLDKYNGLLLAPGYNLAFDRGLISFSDDGILVTSQKLLPGHLPSLGIDPARKLLNLKQEHHVYMQYHRDFVFKK